MTRRSYTLTALSVMVIMGMVSAILAQQPAGGGAPGGGGRGGGAAGGSGRGGGRGQAEPLSLFFKESWKNTAMTPLTQDGVTNPDLLVTQYGPGAKDDFGVTNEGNVNHIWTGICNAACAVTLKHKNNYVDLTGKARIKWQVKTSGFHEVRPVLRLADGTYLIGDHVDSSPFDWRESEFYLSEVHWLKANMPKVLTTGKLLATVDLSKVDEIGFADLTPGSGHGDGGYIDIGSIEVYGKPVPRDAAK
jgi:hypothetical protein